MKTCFVHTVLLASLFMTAVNAVAAPGEVIDPGRRFLEQQQQQQQERLLRKKPGKIEVEKPKKPEKAAPEAPCFPIDGIELKGATLLDGKDRDAILAPYLHACMGTARINRLMYDITQYYVSHGYVTTRAYIPPQNLKRHQLTLLVKEGFVEEMRLNENTSADRRKLASAFPVSTGDILKLQNLEQGLEQMNRVPSSRARMKLWPGTESGGSNVVVENHPQDAFRMTLGYDNSGQQSTGENRVRGGIEWDNILDLNDTWSVFYIGSKDTNAVAASMSVPWGWWTVSFSYSYSEFLTLVSPVAELFGTFNSAVVDVNRVLYRSLKGKTSLDVSLNRKESARVINDVALAAQPLAVVRASLQHRQRFDSGILFADAGFSRGIHALGALSDAPNLPADIPRAQFSKVDAGLNYRQALGTAVTWQLNTRGQYAFDSLFGSEQILLGDNATVRGYIGANVSGDSGLYVRNELQTRLPSFMRSVFTPDLYRRFQPYAFADYGYARLKAAGGGQFLSGGGAGFRYAGDWVSLDLAAAWPIAASNTVQKSDFELYINTTVKLL